MMITGNIFLEGFSMYLILISIKGYPRLFLLEKKPLVIVEMLTEELIF